MGLRIATNTEANNAYRQLNVTQGQFSKSMEKLSSGYRINRAADDAAGLAIAEGLKADTGALKMAVKNSQDAIAAIQTADGAMGEISQMLQRANELAVTYNNGTQNTDSQAALQSEFDALSDEINRIQASTKYNDIDLFAGNTLTFQVGTLSADTIDLVTPTAFDATTDLDITDSDTVQAAITSLSASRSDLGALQNRFEYTINSLNTTAENLSASESRIRDTDMAQEMVKFSKANILQQAGTAMLAQANGASQGVLQLLRG